MATIEQKIEAGARRMRVMRVPITLVDGVATGTFVLPKGAVVHEVSFDTPTTIPGTPTTIYLKLGSAAGGAQYVGATSHDIKAQGWIDATLLYPIRHAAASAPATVHYTTVPTGGTTNDQDGSAVIYVKYSDDV